MQLTIPGTVISIGNLSPDKYPGGTDDTSFVKRILCEGDSWFSLGAIPSSNLLFGLMFAQETLVYNLATPGDTIRNMADISSNPELEKLIVNPQFNTQWDAIFISGGGNDLIDQLQRIICSSSPGAGNNFLDYISRIEMAKLKATIQQGYRTIANLRDQSEKNANTPIVTHIYDYPTPRNAPAKFVGVGFKGPWLYPALKSASVDEKFWISISDYLFEWMGEVLIELVQTIPNFHVISNTASTLIRAELDTSGESGDWLNEIHPTRNGYQKLSDVISPELHLLIQ